MYYMNIKSLIIKITFIFSIVLMAGGFVLVHLGYSFVGMSFHENVIPFFHSLIYLSSNSVFDLSFWFLFIAYILILIVLMSLLEIKISKHNE